MDDDDFHKLEFKCEHRGGFTVTPITRRYFDPTVVWTEKQCNICGVIFCYDRDGKLMNG